MHLFSVCVSAPHVYSAHRGQKRALGALQLELQVIVNRMWFLGIIPGSFTGAASAVNH